jgi:hypothetical protein
VSRSSELTHEVVRTQQKIAETFLPNLLLEICKADGERRAALAARYRKLEVYL